jgi:adenine C2-methylase RlmN of 23S rRNA A2503 and tRNA A37
MLNVITKKISSSAYSAISWNFEDAFRYVFNINGNVLEAGFFIHYLDGVYVKSVVELPISFGCPIKCRHCASGAIPLTKRLSASEIVSMYEFIQNDNILFSKRKVLVTYSGIGEGALQMENLNLASTAIFAMHPGTYFNLSTVGFDPQFIYYCESFSNKLPLNHIQVTYLHHETKKLLSIIPEAGTLGFDFSKLVHAIKESNSHHVRFNYVLIGGFNDGSRDWEDFIKKTESIKSQIIVRITRLNNTPTSLKNGLCSVSEHKMKQLHGLLIAHEYNCHIFFPENDNTMNCGQLSWDYSTESM